MPDPDHDPELLLRGADVDALPRCLGGAELEGRVRAAPEDFVVEEVAAYEPSGSGDHLYVRFEKRDRSTPDAVRGLARALGVDPKDAGYAGLKDRRAVTTQWASFLFGDAARLEGATLDGLRVLEVSRHGNKLRTGHLAANRFRLRLEGAAHSDLPEMAARLDALARRGVPNYFGPQRFGRDGQNVVDAGRWLLHGGRAPRAAWSRKMLVSSLQSAIFNGLLAERVREGTVDGSVAGDLMRVEDTGGLFVSSDPAADAPRLAAFEISPTGPMPGAKVRWPEDEAARREERALAAWGLSREGLARFGKAGPGARRPYRARVSDGLVERCDEGVTIRFSLPPGAYATAVLRELLGRTVG